MTDGHKHRTIRTRKGTLLYRVLRKQLFTTNNRPWVERSRFVFGPSPRPGRWGLSLLGVCHGLFGLTLEVRDD